MCHGKRVADLHPGDSRSVSIIRVDIGVLKNMVKVQTMKLMAMTRAVGA